MTYSTIDLTVTDRIATVRLNRPDQGNAMNEEMHRELHDAWDRVNDDDEIWAAIVTGAGDTFSVGDDLEEIDAALDQGGRPERWNELIGWQNRFRNGDKLSGIPEPSKGRPGKPLVAAVNGACYGPAMMLAVHSDFVLASTTAEFCLPQVSYGLTSIDETIAMTRLTMRPPIMRMALLGDTEKMPAERARQIGLVLETFPPDQLMDRVLEMLNAMNDWSSPMAVRGAKAAIWGTINLHWDDAHRWGHMFLHEVRFHSQDAKEGPRAFAEKRKPQWQTR